MKKKLILIGGGGHCRSCIDVIEQQGAFAIAGIVDQREKRGALVLGYPIMACDEDLPDLLRQYDHFFITIGQIKTCERRMQLFEQITAAGKTLPVLISPLAYVSPHARIGQGTIVMHQALVNAGAQVGMNCIVNTKALVEHDARIDDHCHIATGAIINGGAAVQRASFIGSGAVVREGVSLGAASLVGCQMAVKGDVEPGGVLK